MPDFARAWPTPTKPMVKHYYKVGHVMLQGWIAFIAYTLSRHSLTDSMTDGRLAVLSSLV